MKKTVMTVIRVIVIVGVLGLLTYGGFLGMNRVSGNGDYTIDAYAATDDGGQLTVTKAGTVIHVDCSAEQLAAVAAEPDATFHLTFSYSQNTNRASKKPIPPPLNRRGGRARPTPAPSAERSGSIKAV